MIELDWVKEFHPTSAGLPAGLVDEIVQAGYYPQLVRASLERSVGGEVVLAHLIHHEATFNVDEIHRHLTVLALTPTRLVVGHTDDQAGPTGEVHAITSTESLGLGRITSVGMTQVVAHPETYPSPDAATVETWLTVGWGVMSQIDLQPAACPDPNCEADHGYQGTVTGEDITIRMSPAADGEKSVRALIEFGTALQQVVGR